MKRLYRLKMWLLRLFNLCPCLKGFGKYDTCISATKKGGTKDEIVYPTCEKCFQKTYAMACDNPDICENLEVEYSLPLNFRLAHQNNARGVDDYPHDDFAALFGEHDEVDNIG